MNLIILIGGNIVEFASNSTLGVVLAGGVVVGMATASLLGTWNTRHEMATGYPDYLSLADYTGVFDRSELERLCGPPDPEDRYYVPPESARTLPKRLWSRLLGSPLLDAVSLAVASVATWMAITERPGAWWVVGAAVAYQIISWTVTVRIVLKHSSRP